MLPKFAFVRPKTLEDAIEQLATAGARVHAGGTDLLGCLRERVFDISTLVSISGLEDLKGIRQTAGGGLRIGALTTVAEAARHPLVLEHYPGLAQAALAVASPQLRNQGTVGGNICQKPRCWYYRGEFHCLRKGGDTCYALGGENQFHCILGGDMCYIVHPSDMAPALCAFEAAVRIAGPQGRRSVPMSEFHVLPEVDFEKETVLAPDEILYEILLPPTGPGTHSRYRKVRARQAWDFALAGAAMVVQLDEDRILRARVVLSGAAPVPWRSIPLEKVIAGTNLDDNTIARAAEAVVEGASPLAQNAYKLNLFQGMIREELQAVRTMMRKGSGAPSG